MKDRKIAALLAIFLGWAGVHKFYLRDTGSGIFYIMLTMFGSSLGFPIGGILGWIDAFALLTMSDERFDKKYNSGNSRTIKRSRSRTERRSSRSSERSSRRRDNRYESNDVRRTNRDRKDPYRQPARKRKVIKDNPFKTSGIKRLKDFELDLAEADLNRALELSPDDMDIHFALGQLYSLNEDKQKSFYHLAKSVNLGYADLAKMRTADELAYLRIQAEFDVFEQSGYRVVPIAGSTAEKSAPQQQTQQKPPANDLLQDDLLLSQLNKLAELRKKGLLSEKEFQEEKIKLTRR